MKPFLVLRVPVALEIDKSPKRRSPVGIAATVVAEADNFTEASAIVGSLARGDARHHYYGLEVKLLGDAERKTAIVVGRKPAPKRSKPVLVSSQPIPLQLERK